MPEWHNIPAFNIYLHWIIDEWWTSWFCHIHRHSMFLHRMSLQIIFLQLIIVTNISLFLLWAVLGGFVCIINFYFYFLFLDFLTTWYLPKDCSSFVFFWRLYVRHFTWIHPYGWVSVSMFTDNHCRGAFPLVMLISYNLHYLSCSMWLCRDTLVFRKYWIIYWHILQICPSNNYTK